MDSVIMVLLTLLVAFIIGLAPKGIFLLILFFGIAGLIQMLLGRGSPKAVTSLTLYPLFALVGLSLVSFFWSEQAGLTSKYAGRFLMIVLFTLAAANYIDQMTQASVKRMLSHLTFGCLFGLAIAAMFSMAFFVHHLLGIELSPELDIQENDLARQIAKSFNLVITLLFALAPFIRQRLGRFFYPAMVVLILIVIVSDSQSAFLSLFIGSIFYLIAKRNAVLANRLFIAGLAFAFVLIIPLANFNYHYISKQKIVTVDWLDVSYDVRSGSYKFFADKILTKPVLGHGFFAGRIYTPDPWPAYLKPEWQSSITPHNLHLQILFDLGFVGATLFIVLVGLLLDQGLRNLPPPCQPGMVAAAAAFSGATAFNFLLWQPWLLSLFALICLVFLIQQRMPKDGLTGDTK